MKLSTAMELYKAQKLSLGKASELAGMNITEFMFELGKHEIPVINYDVDDFKEEIESVTNSGKLDNTSLSYAGSWQEMNADLFDDYMADIAHRRNKASRRD